MAYRLVRIQNLRAKIETVEGTDIVPATTDSVRCREAATFTYDQEFKNARSGVITGLLDGLGPLQPAGNIATLEFDVELRGFGAAYSAANKPEIDALLRACAMSVTTSFTGGSEFYRYDTASTSTETVSMYFDMDGKRWKSLATRGTVAMTFPAGGPATAKFTMKGLMTQAADVAFTAGTFQTSQPPIGKSMVFSYNAISTMVLREFGIDIGNEVNARPNATATDALVGMVIPSRAPSFTLRVEDPLVAAIDFETDIRAGVANGRVVASTFGSIQYNRIKIDADKATPTGIAWANEGGIPVATVTGVLSAEGTNRCRIGFD